MPCYVLMVGILLTPVCPLRASSQRGFQEEFLLFPVFSSVHSLFFSTNAADLKGCKFFFFSRGSDMRQGWDYSHVFALSGTTIC